MAAVYEFANSIGGEGISVASTDPLAWMQLFGDMPTDAGAFVNPQTSMRVGAVYACVRLISGTMASLPVNFYKRLPGRGKLPIDSDFWYLLNEQPAPGFTAASFWEFMTMNVLLRGDGIAYIDRKNQYTNDINSIIPFKREAVNIRQVASVNPRKPIRLAYDFTTPTGTFTADQDDVLHFPGFGFDGVSSLSVIQWGARSSTGIAMRADEFAGKFFSNGAQPQHVLTTPGKMTPDKAEQVRTSFAARYQGTGPNGLPLVLTEGMDIKPLSLSMADAKLIEQKQMSVIDIARAFGVPPFMIGETTNATSFGTGIDSMGQGFIDYTMSPYMRRFSQELNRKLFLRGTSMAEFDSKGLMQGNVQARAVYNQAALGGTQNQGWAAVNEVRASEGLPPIPNGDSVSTTIKTNTPDDNSGGAGGE